jgi:K+-sensing histidine kinase KdpD
MDEEEKRLNSLYQLKILDTDFDAAFDQITKLVETVLQVPIVLVSLIDRNRQWFKSCIGVNIRETPREYSLCSDAIKEGNNIYMIEDALAHPLYQNNPFVTGEPNIRFYAGKPISGYDSYRLGTICVMDRQPRKLSDKQQLLLEICSSLVESELKKLYYIRKCEQNEKHISSIMTHDLVNSLSPIISITELLLYDNKHINSDWIKDLETIHQAGIQTLSLSRDLIDAIKLDLKKITLAKEPTGIKQILKPFINDKDIQIEYFVSHDLTINVDESRIIQIISNMISNAKDFGTKKVMIRVIIIDGDYLQISVQDYGIGIPYDKRHLLFQQFSENIHPDVKRSKPRTGLGLFICKELVALHRGKIWLDETMEKGVGAKFCFTLPLF